MFTLLSIAILLNASRGYCQGKQEVFPGDSWTVSENPSKSGWSDKRLILARAYADSIGSACVMIVHHGVIVSQWGDVAHKYNSYSIREGLLSALYGIYSVNKVIDITQSLLAADIDDNPPSLSNHERQARIADLLRSRSGVYHPVDFESQAMKDNRPVRGSHIPGTYWFYNTWDFNALGTIFEKKVKISIADAFQQHIASPIGMEDYKVEDCKYLPGTISRHPAFQFQISTRDLARFGLLYLRNGQWKGNTIIPKEWVHKSTHADEVISTSTITAGYENLWWIDNDGTLYPEIQEDLGLFAAIGFGEQALIVIPRYDIVVVHQITTPDIVSGDTLQPKTPVTREQVGHLLKLILKARPSR